MPRPLGYRMSPASRRQSSASQVERYRRLRELLEVTDLSTESLSSYEDGVDRELDFPSDSESTH